MKQAILFYLLLIILASSCTLDSPSPSSPQGFMSDEDVFSTVMPELRPFYIAFEEEAAERGIDINLSEIGVTGNIVQLGNNSILGLCRRLENEPNRIAIDIEAWLNSTEAFKEKIVFHELGHCVLDRDHFDDDVDGVCVSIMNSGLSGCEFILEDPDAREAYLDELFLP